MIFINFVIPTTKPFATRIAGLVQHRIGNSGADSCKLNICNSIGHLCKCWADVFQMPHHRQYVNRYAQAEKRQRHSKLTMTME